jgi:hypothetical protein
MREACTLRSNAEELTSGHPVAAIRSADESDGLRSDVGIPDEPISVWERI